MSDRLERFLFAPVDPRVAAVFRIAFAGVLAVLFWPKARWPLPWLAQIPGSLELFVHVFGSPPWWGATLLALLAWGAGVRVRITGWLVLALLLPQALLLGVDKSRQILLFSFLAFTLLQSDARLSLLRWGRGAQRASAGPMWPVRLIQLQLSLVYGVNALVKATPEYLSGEALVWMSAHLPNFLVDLSDGALHVGPLAIPVWLCAAGTVTVEAALAIGVWLPRLRVATALLGVAFHMSLRFVVVIGWLDWACLFLYASFLLPFERREPGASEANLAAPTQRPA